MQVGLGRRVVVTSVLLGSMHLDPPTRGPKATVLRLPLQTTPGGVLTTGVFIDGEPFRLIVDTGSPYLVVALDDCDTQPPRLSAYGCASPGQFDKSGLPGTAEQYGALPGRMEWLKGDVTFGDTEVMADEAGNLALRLRLRDAGRTGGRLVFGGADRKVMSQSGGALLGLIRRVNNDAISTIPAADLRPTALAQLGLSSFCLDASQCMLTLSSEELIRAEADALRLLDPRPYGDGVEHLCCRVDGDGLVIDGKLRRTRRPVLCVFDSGLTGCVLSQALVEELELEGLITSADGRMAVQSLQLALCTERGRKVVLQSSTRDSALFYAQAIRLGWFADRINGKCEDGQCGPHVVAVGQCVLGRGAFTVDSSTRRALWEPAV